MSISVMQDNIKHIIHLMLENRSFDTTLGQIYSNTDKSQFPRSHIPTLRRNEQEFYGLPADAWVASTADFYKKSTGWKKLAIQKNSNGCCHSPPDDPGERFDSVREQLYGPYGDTKDPAQYMKGFYINYQRDRAPSVGPDSEILKAYGKVDGTWELNVLSTLAQQYAVSDLWFSSVPTQTNPNRAFSIMGSSLGRINNNDDKRLGGYAVCGQTFGAKHSTIFSVLNYQRKRNPEAKIPATWKLYADNKWGGGKLRAEWDFLYYVGRAGGQCATATEEKYYTQYMFPAGMEGSDASYGCILDLLKDIEKDRMPSFCYVEPSFFPQAIYEFQSYHPPGSPYWGELLVKCIFDKLQANRKVFEKTLFVITFDEHGGTYDHLYPPAAPPPDGYVDPSFSFDRYGVRVPTILVSPRIQPGTVIRPPYYPETVGPALPFDHTSFLATLCKWMDISTKSGLDFPLGYRTSVAPTFEAVITSEVVNGYRGSPTVYDCTNDKSKGCYTPLGVLKRRGIGAHIAKLTGHAEGSLENERLLQQIADTCRSDAEVLEVLRQLKGKAGEASP